MTTKQYIIIKHKLQIIKDVSDIYIAPKRGISHLYDDNFSILNDTARTMYYALRPSTTFFSPPQQSGLAIIPEDAHNDLLITKRLLNHINNLWTVYKKQLFTILPEFKLQHLNFCFYTKEIIPLSSKLCDFLMNLQYLIKCDDDNFYEICTINTTTFEQAEVIYRHIYKYIKETK